MNFRNAIQLLLLLLFLLLLLLLLLLLQLRTKGVNQFIANVALLHSLKSCY
jgi:hypothetical protein